VRGVELVLVAVLAFILAQGVWLVIYGDAVRPLSVDTDTALSVSGGARATDLSILSSSGLFEEPANESITAPVIAPQTRLNLTLRGVRSGTDPRSGAAFIETPRSGQRSYGVGDEIADGVELEEIYEDRVIISRRGARESLFISEDAARRAREAAAAPRTAQTPMRSDAEATGDNPVLGSNAGGDTAGIDADALMDGLRLMPEVVDGQVRGFRVRENSDPALLSAVGLRAGDIITALNGERLTSVEAAQRALALIETQARLSLALERGGQPMNIDVAL
jgi:general secretion pathway protein C